MSIVFASKSAASDVKLRGGFYTPRPIAKFVAEWVAKAGPRTLEPSCGDGSILTELALVSEPVGVELFPEEAAKARCLSTADVAIGDFFEWLTADRLGTFDGVAGNPPYIRFGSWAEQYRERALGFMRGRGLHPNRLTNAWLPFVVGAMAALRDGGRVGLVLPAEILQVGYAAELRGYLVDECSEITIISFQELVFPGVLQEVVLMLAVKGAGPAAITTAEVPSAFHLKASVFTAAATRAPLHATEKWTKYYLEPDQIEAMRSMRSDARLFKMSDFAKVNVGVVTGRNSFFAMSEAEASDRRISDHTISLLSRSKQFTGVRFTAEDLQRQSAGSSNTRLLAIPPDFDLSLSEALRHYIDLGEREEVHLGYKCRIRKKWWSVPSVSTPDGFMLRQVSNVLRLISNDVGATSTDTVHRVFARPGVDMTALAVAALNTVTLAMAETMGRSYGGGLLEVEPSEAASLPLPDPVHVTEELSREVDELVRRDEIEAAIALVDQRLLVDALGFDPAEVKRVRASWRLLRERRLRRGRK